MRSFLNILDKLMLNKYFFWIFITLSIISLLISFSLKINLSNVLGIYSNNEYLLNYGIEAKNGGVVNDLRTHWEYIIALKEDLNNLFIYTLGDDTNLINYPLHNLIFSHLDFIKSLNDYLITILYFAHFTINLLFILKNTFQKLRQICNHNTILNYFNFSGFSILCDLGNNHNTALIFLL